MIHTLQSEDIRIDRIFSNKTKKFHLNNDLAPHTVGFKNISQSKGPSAYHFKTLSLA